MGLIRRTDHGRNVAGRFLLLAPLSLTMAVFSTVSAFCGLIPDSEFWEILLRDWDWIWAAPLSPEKASPQY